METTTKEINPIDLLGMGIQCTAKGGLSCGTHLIAFLPDMNERTFREFCQKWNLKVSSMYDPDKGYDLETEFAYFDRHEGVLHMVTIYDRAGAWRIGGHSDMAIKICEAMGLKVRI